MQYMIMRKADAASEAGRPPSARVRDDMARFHRQLEAAGLLGLTLDLCPTAQALRLKMWPGGESVTHGPFGPPEDQLAGFTIIEAASKEAALAQARHWPAGDGETLLELRETGCPGGCAQVPPAAAGDARRYAILLRSDAASERDTIPPRAMLDTLDAFNAAQAAAGVLLAGDGLKATARGARVRLAGGKAAVLDGPFTEAKELIAGFWMIKAASLADALDWARQLPYPTGPRVEVEIREVQDAARQHAAEAANDARADAGLRAEQLDAALRAQFAARPAWH